MNLRELLEQIPCDKRLHALIGVVYASILLLLSLPMLYVAVSLVIIAYGIEFYQLHTKSGQFEHWDAIAVIIGGLLVMIPNI